MSERGLGRRHYYQGGHDLQFVEPLDPRLECAICLLCQRDPHQTACGHRFCHSCIMTWLSEGRTCPDDNTTLTPDNIFPDAIARREIQQLSVRCVHAGQGCQETMTVAQVSDHLTSCPFSRLSDTQSLTCPQCGECPELEHDQELDPVLSRHQSLVCPHSLVACSLAPVGCDQRLTRGELGAHMVTSIGAHIRLLADKMTKLQQTQGAERLYVRAEEEEEGVCSSLPGSPLTREFQGVRMSGSNFHSQARIIRELFQKVITLEQNQCQSDIKISQLSSQVEALKIEKEEILNRSMNGEYVWKIKDFSSYHQKMRNSHNFVIYSKGFYTSYYGYKVCLRSNIYFSEGEEYLAIFVHFMKGENDDILAWPWQGNITIEMVHQSRDIPRENILESIDSIPKSDAFKRPNNDRNMIGFGFQTFVRVNSLYTEGFLDPEMNTLVVKAKVVSV